MPRRVLKFFMWGFQSHFRLTLEIQARHLLETLGLPDEPRALLVGARKPGRSDPNPVCLEPEDGEWTVSQFAGLLDAVEAIDRQHPERGILYGDERATREQPERIRRDSVRQAVAAALKPGDATTGFRSFCGSARPVGEFYVVPAVQIPERLFTAHPGLGDEPIVRNALSSSPSFLHAAIAIVLDEASSELERPDAGQRLAESRDAREILREAASTFMRSVGLSFGDRAPWTDLFERLNLVSSMFYEGTAGAGGLVLAAADHPAVERVLTFAAPVPLDEPRWARKALQLATADLALVADCSHVYGLGRLSREYDPSTRDAFSVDFLEHYHWQVRSGDQVLLRSRYGEPSLAHEPLPRPRFVDNFRRIFPGAAEVDADRLWDVFRAASALPHGASVIVADDAAAEAVRLAGQGARVEPVPLSAGLLARVSAIDGSVILDPHGTCHAIGVILDGMASPACSPARGSRYNSAIRYVGTTKAARLAIVVSDDRSVDVIPMLRPRIRRADFEAAMASLDAATLDDYHRPRQWLDERRFYAEPADCARINAALDRIESLPRGLGEIVIQTERFSAHPQMGADYWIPP